MMGNIRYILLLFFSLLLIESCVNTDIEPMVKPLADKNIKLHLLSPSTNIVGSNTRSGDSANEWTIQRGYLFIFSDEGIFKGFQKIVASDVVDNNTQYPVIKATVDDYDSSVDKLIAVFNYCERSFLGEDDFDNITKESVSDYFPLDKAYLDTLQVELTSNKYTLGMPMFVNDFDNHSHSVHEVYRALARIELFVQNTDVSTSLIDHSHSFTAENVEYTLVNSTENGLIGFESIDQAVGKAGGSTYQPNETLTFDHRPTAYKATDDVSSLKSSSNAIYLYEFPYSTQVISNSAVTQGVYDAERLSILIKHVDEEAHPGITFYYKLQLIDKETNEYYDIKRNHDYRVVITNVYSDGYTDVNEAYLMPPSNIEYEVFDDKGDLTFSNGQYAISMDEVLNYESVTIYGPDTTTLSFDNIRRILPPEVADPLTDEELEQMTNEVQFSIVSQTDSITVSEIQNDFKTNNKLTDDGKSIKLSLSGKGECIIKLKIKLGNLEMGFDEIKIVKIGNDGLGGDSSFDAHPCQLVIKNQNIIEGTWNSPDSDFGARNDVDSIVVYMGENATPVGYKTLNGYITSGTATNAYPYFEPKTRTGFFSYYDLENDPERTTVKKTKIVLNQLAPFYVGHFGNHADRGPHYYNSVIVEKIEEIRKIEEWSGKTLSETNGVMNWSEMIYKTYYIQDMIYGSYMGLEKYLNFSSGRDITEYIVENNKSTGSLPLAARYCYMKNDIDGDGVIEENEPIVWYLPAVNQMMAMWISKQLIESELDNKYYGFSLVDALNPWYWTCSEVAELEDQIKNRNFSANVAAFNILEGEMRTSTRKGKGGFDDKAHVRCVRGILYDNSK